jgi:ADP-heptose:LPS heptosyltransferase
MSKYHVDHDQDTDEYSLLDTNDEEVDDDTATQVIYGLNKNYSNARQTTVYLMYSSTMNMYKIGITSRRINIRKNKIRKQFQDETVEVLHTFLCANRKEAKMKEAMLHRLFSHKNQRLHNGRDLGKEWFCLSESDISFFKSDNLFLSSRDNLIFHPFAFLRYAVDEKNCSQEIYQMLVHFTEQFTLLTSST